MNPAFSVILLTTLTGAGQGLFLALYGAELFARAHLIPMPAHHAFFAVGSAVVVVLASLGLVASFFHLGRPGRAWRSASKWRTSWLSREVIALPAFIGMSALYGLAHQLDWDGTGLIGAVGTLISVCLFLCTGMIYACIRFLQEWSTPLTVVNYFVLGIASGFTLATAFTAVAAPDLASHYARMAAFLTFTGLLTRLASLARNARLRPKSTLQTAIGVRHPHIVQKSQGFMGGSFNTREFFHKKIPPVAASGQMGVPVAGVRDSTVRAADGRRFECGSGAYRICCSIHRSARGALVLFCGSQSSTEPVLPGDLLTFTCIYTVTIAGPLSDCRS